MAATAYVSTQFDNPERIAAEFAAQIGPLSPEEAQCSFGFLVCDAQVDVERLATLLAEALPFPVLGATTVSSPVPYRSGEEPDETSAVLTVLSRPGLLCSVAVSSPLDDACRAGQARDLYQRCRERLGAEPKLVITLFPYMADTNIESFADKIFALSGDIPVIGGISTGDMVSAPPRIMAEGHALSNRAVLVMFGGNVRPVCATATKITRMTEYAPMVTKSRGYNVYSVDNSPFIDYLKHLGVISESAGDEVEAYTQYGPIPVEMHIERPEDGVPTVRCISSTNPEDGHATFSGNVPEGCRISISTLEREDVAESVRLAFERLKADMEPEYDQEDSHGIILCISCAARYFAMAGNAIKESGLMLPFMPAGFVASGFYALGEVGPTRPLAGNTLSNRFHSTSLVLCAL